MFMQAKPFRLAVKAVVFDSQKRCLLMRRSAVNRNFVGCWEWPGGKVDDGEDFTTALLREAREETSLEVEITGLAGAAEFETPKASVVLLCLEGHVIGGSMRLSEEHDAFEWVNPVDFHRYELLPGVQDFMIEYASRKGASRA